MNKVISDTRVPVKIWATDLEPEAEKQVRNVASMPFIFKHVSVMPDAHAGKGSTVGTVIATEGAIIPAAVGVDIGCGMCAMKLPFKVDELGGDAGLRKLRHSIERAVPTGMTSNRTLTETAKERWGAIYREDMTMKVALALGSLGGGNHFIEICRDTDDTCWIMLHSGSRNVGKVLAEKHINRAKGLMKQYFINLPDPDLAYLVQGSVEFDEYKDDLLWAQQFAELNREEMLDRVLREVLWHVGKLDKYKEWKNTLFKVNCHHNYTQLENHFGKNIWVTRKGAVSAREGQYGIIPGSMGTRSYIVRGKGNADSFCSCSHGAGRKMSRTKARAAFTLEDLKQQTAGIECRKDDAVLDEIPAAYKDIDIVMANQQDLVDVAYELRQLICIKGA